MREFDIATELESIGVAHPPPLILLPVLTDGGLFPTPFIAVTGGGLFPLVQQSKRGNNFGADALRLIARNAFTLLVPYANAKTTPANIIRTIIPQYITDLEYAEKLM